MESKIPTFFEISINSQKLTAFVTTINTLLLSHDKKIESLNRDIYNIKTYMDDKISHGKKELEYEVEKIHRKSKENYQFIEAYISDIKQKEDHYETQERQVIQTLKDQMYQMQADLRQAMQQETNNLQTQIDLRVERERQRLQKSIEVQVNSCHFKVAKLQAQLKQAIQSNDFAIKSILEKDQNRKIKDQTETNDLEPIYVTPKVSKKHTAESNRFYSGADKHTMEKMHQILEHMTIKEGRQRKKRRARENSMQLQQNLQYATISAKIDQLESRLVQKENQPINKILYPAQQSRHIDHIVQSEASQNSLSLSMSKIQMQRKSLEQNITLKLQHIEQIIEEKYIRLEKQILKMTAKNETIGEQVQIVNRKVEKQKSKLSEVQLQIKKMEDKKIDEKIIDNIMNIVKRHNQNLEDTIQKKLDADIYHKQKNRINQRLRIFADEMLQKADKTQVKRAFMFVEDKLREIIVVIADDIHNEKEGAAKRVPFKCLSCDKDLESNAQSKSKEKSILKNTNRCVTSQLRRRVRISNNGSQIPCDLE